MFQLTSFHGGMPTLGNDIRIHDITELMDTIQRAREILGDMSNLGNDPMSDLDTDDDDDDLPDLINDPCADNSQYVYDMEYDPIVRTMGNIHQYSTICDCKICGAKNAARELHRMGLYEAYPVVYVDSAIEEIERFGSWKHDGYVWLCSQDEVIDYMRLRYPEYGCSFKRQRGKTRLRIGICAFTVYLHKLPVFVCDGSAPYSVAHDVIQN